MDPGGLGPIQVLCDQGTNGGGWTVFQKRLDGSEDFFRDWADYEHGFGNLIGEFWLGLEALHLLTWQDSSRLRIELEDFNSSYAYAAYGFFSVSNSSDNYRLTIGDYSGRCKALSDESSARDPIQCTCAGSQSSSSNPFTPKGDQLQISPVASLEILHHPVWRTWLFTAYSDKR